MANINVNSKHLNGTVPEEYLVKELKRSNTDKPRYKEVPANCFTIASFPYSKGHVIE